MQGPPLPGAPEEFPTTDKIKSIGRVRLPGKTLPNVRASSWPCGQQQATAHCRVKSHHLGSRSANSSYFQTNEDTSNFVRCSGLPFSTERACSIPSTASRHPCRAWEAAGRSPSTLLDPSTRRVSPSPVHGHERKEPGRPEACSRPAPQKALTSGSHVDIRT